MIASIMQLLSAFGLSTAAGLNAFLPMLTVGVLSRFGLIELSQPFDLLGHPVVLVLLAVLALLDFIGDKIPAVDHVLHIAGLVVHPIAGAVLFVAANHTVGNVDSTLAAICGVVIAGAAHLARASVRPVVTAATAGTGNPVISVVEDVTALVLSVLAIMFPVVAIVLVVVLLFLAVRFFGRAMGVWRNRHVSRTP